MSQPLSILMVDDDDLLRELIVEALQELGHTVHAAADGPAALAMIEAGGHYDVLFSDVSMPKGMTGVDLAVRARALRPDLHVVLASGYARAQLPPLPDNVAFLPKPYRIPQIVELITTAGVA